MLPPAKDAIDGVLLITNLARIYALTGEKDLALEQLDTVSKIPCGPTYGELRLDSLLGLSARRSALRENRRLARAERIGRIFRTLRTRKLRDSARKQ